MKIAIVKYNAGNIQSVIYALNRLGVDPLLTDDPEELKSADKVIFPGVGEASSAMRYLRKMGLAELLPSLEQPFFGICIGQQLMCAHSEEGDVDCLGIFPIDVKHFEVGGAEKVPHMGWNEINGLKTDLFKGIHSSTDQVYFVHSYYCEWNENHGIASTDYIIKYAAALQKDNFYAVQFHPEKSGKVGERIIKNFLDL